MLLPYCAALALQANALITRQVIFSDTCFVAEKIGWLGITWFDLGTQSDADGAAGKR